MPHWTLAEAPEFDPASNFVRFTIAQDSDSVTVNIEAAAIEEFVGSPRMTSAQRVSFVRSNMPRLIRRAIDKRDRYGLGAADRVQLGVGDLELGDPGETATV